MKLSTPIAALAALALPFSAVLPAVAGDCGSKSNVTMPASHTTVSSHSSSLVNVVDTAQSAGFDTLLAAASAAGLVDALKTTDPITVFAPTDAAFAKLGQATIADLLKPENQHKLADILKYHVVPGRVPLSALAGKVLSADTLNGSLIVDGRDGVRVNAVSVVKADVEASNGIIHVIDEVLLPPSNG